LLVGHNPGLEQLVLRLVPQGVDGARGQIEVKYPTASLAEMTFAVDHWRDVEEGGGDLIRFVRPRDLDPELGPEYG
jgi:phosphohistidine phosphatase